MAQLERALDLLRPRFEDEFFVRGEVTVEQAGKREKTTIQGAHAGFQVGSGVRRRLVAPGELIPHLAGEARAAGQVELRLIRRNETVVVTASDRGTRVRMEKPLGDLGRDQPLDPAAAQDLLFALGFTDAGGELRPGEMRKYNQVNQFLKAAEPLLRDPAVTGGEGPFAVIDAACGKSPLSFVLNFYLTQVLRRQPYVIGIDIAPGVIAAANRTLEELGYKNAEYRVASVAEYAYDKPWPVGLVVSLHACDTATDEALAAGVRWGARAMLLVPCCQSELLGQIEPGRETDPLAILFRHGLLKARLADLLTDAVRCLALEANGYSLSVQEFCSPLDTPKNLMIRAVRTTDRLRAESARREYRALQERFGLAPRVLDGLFG